MILMAMLSPSCTLMNPVSSLETNCRLETTTCFILHHPLGACARLRTEQTHNACTDTLDVQRAYANQTRRLRRNDYHANQHSLERACSKACVHGCTAYSEACTHTAPLQPHNKGDNQLPLSCP